jgi:hypothetical protein
MNIRELLIKERQDYLTALVGSFREHQEKYPPAAMEVLIKLNNTSDFPPPYCFRRPDILCGGIEKPQIIEINKDQFYSFDCHKFSITGEIDGRLFPIRWNGIEFRVFGKIDPWSEFELWVHRWMDIDDARYEEGKELMNVIHDVTLPKHKGDYYEFSVDMGSAEVDAFFELLSLFPKMGVTKFDVGSFSMIATQ